MTSWCALRSERPDQCGGETRHRAFRAISRLGDFGRALLELGRTKRLVAKLAPRVTHREEEIAPFSNMLHHQDVVQLRFQAAMILLDVGRWHQVRSVLEASAEDVASLGPASSLDYYFARLALGEHRYDDALELIDCSYAHFDRFPPLYSRRGALRVLRAMTLIESGRAAEALPVAQEGVRLLAEADQRESIWKAHWQEARAARVVSGDAAALPVFDQTVAALDNVRRASLGLRLDSLFLKERLPAVEDAILCAAAYGDASRCLTYADAVKSRFLARALRRGSRLFLELNRLRRWTSSTQQLVPPRPWRTVGR